MLQIPFIYKATIVNVVDGDTVDAIIDLGFKMTTIQRLRLYGVNTPELRGVKAQPELALAAKALTATLLNKEVIIKTHKSDSFGRWLAVIYVGETNFNAQLVELGLAVKYMDRGELDA